MHGGAAVTGSDSVKGVVESGEESAIVSMRCAMDVFGEDIDEGVAVFDSDGIKGATVSGDCGDDFSGGFTVDEGYFKIVINS
ncbi:hypothetical protein Tco_0052313 [Tanacetum coccineum]